MTDLFKRPPSNGLGIASADGHGSYTISYETSAVRLVQNYSIRELLEKYGDILWESGRHKYNVTSFLGEINEILLGRQFSVFGDEALDFVLGTLRERGNSNATINRKMAALSKLLRKALKMGDLHSLPEFRRQRERAGRIRFLEWDEEDRLFQAIARRSPDAHRLAVFLVDTGCRLGEGLGVVWNDLSHGRVTFWLTKSGRSRTVPLTVRAQGATTCEVRLKGPFAMLSAVHFRAIWNEAKLEVGLGDDIQVVPHILRHTCPSRPDASQWPSRPSRLAGCKTSP